MTVSSAVQDRTARGCVSYHAGRAAELTVSRNYLRRGFALAHERWRGRSGEIDLIVEGHGVVAFSEIKPRSSEAYGHPSEAVDERRRRRLRRAAAEWLAARGGRTGAVRFDVVSVLPDRGDRLEGAF